MTAAVEALAGRIAAAAASGIVVEAGIAAEVGIAAAAEADTEAGTVVGAGPEHIAAAEPDIAVAGRHIAVVGRHTAVEVNIAVDTVVAAPGAESQIA
jgi:hypothetical protein